MQILRNIHEKLLFIAPSLLNVPLAISFLFSPLRVVEDQDLHHARQRDACSVGDALEFFPRLGIDSRVEDHLFSSPWRWASPIARRVFTECLRFGFELFFSSSAIDSHSSSPSSRALMLFSSLTSSTSKSVRHGAAVAKI